jgi:hypothetical protein
MESHSPDRTTGSSPDEQTGGKVRKPYKKPAFEWERVFETMALACGKINSSQQQCKINKKHS